MAASSCHSSALVSERAESITDEDLSNESIAVKSYKVSVQLSCH